MSSGSVSSDQWIEISVNVDHEAVEPVVELFSRYGYNNGVAIEEPFTQDPDGDNLTVDLQRPVSVRTFLPFDGFTSETKDRIERALWSLGQMRPVGPLMVSIHQEQDWENAWKQHFTPLRASKTIIIRPPWHDVDPEPDDLVVTLDPGMAFGTGTGVLALAARLLGARHVDAVDIDPIAVRQAAKNFEMNDQADGIRVWQDSMEQPPSREHYDFVIANIISRILIEVHPALVASMRPAGMVLLSGIIDTKEQLVVDCYQQTGLEMIERRQMGDWIAHIWANRAEGQGSG